MMTMHNDIHIPITRREMRKQISKSCIHCKGECREDQLHHWCSLDRKYITCILYVPCFYATLLLIKSNVPTRIYRHWIKMYPTIGIQLQSSGGKTAFAGSMSAHQQNMIMQPLQTLSYIEYNTRGNLCIFHLMMIVRWITNISCQALKYEWVSYKDTTSYIFAN